MDAVELAEIGELSLLRDIEEIADRYRAKFGVAPINLSTWDPDPGLRTRALIVPPRISALEVVDYSFSYTNLRRRELVRALGFRAERDCLLVHSGSAAIVAMVNWLRAANKRLLIIGPRYFTVPHACAAFGVSHSLTRLVRSDAGYRLPAGILDLARGADALWITNPVYCTGRDFFAGDLAILSDVAKAGAALIIDECLCEAGREIAPKLCDAGEVFSIHAPHKAVCINGIKFAALVHDACWARFFETWSDVWFGCLPASSNLAIEHYLSGDYDAYSIAFGDECKEASHALEAIVKKYPRLSLDVDASGYLVSVFAPALKAELGLNPAFLERAAHASGAIFIAGLRNEMDPEAGFSFRVNLAALGAGSRGALDRLCYWLDAESS